MNSGSLISVLEKIRLDFSSLPATASQSVTLRSNIHVVPYSTAALWVRVHARDMAAGQTLRLALRNSLPSAEDPREFVDPTDMLAVDITSSAPTAIPGIGWDSSSRIGPYLNLVAIATQTSVSTTFYADVSVELLLRVGL
jgi:hypothetical protein